MAFFQDEMYPHSDMGKMSIREFEQSIDDGDMMVPDYQRNYVWNKKDQQSYLQSISIGFPLFGPVINLDQITGNRMIMDGQNRLMTIYKFLKDEIYYEDEDDIKLKFSDLADSQKRRFRTTTISFLETRNWMNATCQEFFVAMNGGGKALKPGELINAERDNILTQKILEWSNITGTYGKYGATFDNKAKDGGLDLTKGKKERYFNYEIMGLIFHMVLTEEFPVRPGDTSLNELIKWREKEISSIFVSTCEKVEILMDAYKNVLQNVPRLGKRVPPATHMRLMFFMFKSGIYCTPLDNTHFARIERILNVVLNKDNPEYGLIITWGTVDSMKIYELYNQIFMGTYSVP